MTSARPVYAGLDLGASRTKVALIGADGTLLGQAVKKSGINFTHTARVRGCGAAGVGVLCAQQAGCR